MAFAKIMGSKYENWAEKNYGPLGKSIDEILSHAETKPRGTIIGAIYFRISQKKARSEASLTKAERIFYTVTLFQAEVDNGGFDQYFFNSSGDNAAIAFEGLQAIGAYRAQELLGRAMAVFEGGKPSANRAERQIEMGRITGRAMPVWDECGTEFYRLSDSNEESIDNLLLAYVIKNKGKFVF